MLRVSRRQLTASWFNGRRIRKIGVGGTELQLWTLIMKCASVGRIEILYRMTDNEDDIGKIYHKESCYQLILQCRGLVVFFQ